jgi:outer membrane scaffolding protein for murein synthesis (MipA/OmpV family)
MKTATYAGMTLGLVLALSIPALAQPGRPAPREWDIRAGAGVMMRSTFDGSDRYRARPLPYLAVNWRDTLTFDQTGLNAQLRRQNYRIGLGLTFDGGREEQNTGGIFASGDDRLLGMGDIDFALGVRASAAWQIGPVELSAQVTKFTGAQNDGLLGRAGLSMPMPLGQALMLIPSISVGWADDRYMQTFFGVTPQQASRSVFTRFSAGSGFQDARAGVNLVYSFHRNWFANFNVGVTQLLGDSATSPISLSDTSLTGIAIVGYRF